MTVLEVIQRGTEFLAKKGVDSPRLQLELMLAQILSLPRLKLYLEFERQLNETEAARLRDMVRRRAEREPLQHILGTAHFCGLELEVDRRALVPRPETELLAEKAWQFLESLDPQPLAVLDLGTGSGCLAIALAKRLPSAAVHAVDLSEEALAVAQLNAARHTVPVQFHQGDYFHALTGRPKFHLIVSNPPYIPTGELDELQPEVRDHDPRMALDGGPDGLGHYRRLASDGRDHLHLEGRLMLELGYGQAEAVGNILKDSGWKVESVDNDYAGIPRILVAAGTKD